MKKIIVVEFVNGAELPVLENGTWASRPMYEADVEDNLNYLREQLENNGMAVKITVKDA